MAKSSTLSPIDDLTYDVITVLQSKARGLEAYDKYINDADEEGDEELKSLFIEIRRKDEDDIQVLKESLARRLDEDLGYDDLDDDDDDIDDEIDEHDEPGSLEELPRVSSAAPGSSGTREPQPRDR